MTGSANAPGRRLLVLGGTSWLGGAVARGALARGHELTCLARGLSGQVPEGARLVHADRADADAYRALDGQRFDAAVEISWQPDFVRQGLDALDSRVGHWVYVSSVSVYSDDSIPGADEAAPTCRPFAGPGPARLHDYGSAKVACEQAVVRAVGERGCSIARAGLIGGYGDRSDRLGYWPGRLARVRSPGERVLVPPLDGPVQVIDVADLAAWLLHCAEQRVPGTFNATGDVHPFRDLLDASRAATDRTVVAVEASDSWLLEHRVEPYMGPESLPLWLPQADHAGHATRRNDAARAAGLRLRPLADTVADALAWERRLGLDRERAAGLSSGRERELLALLA